MIKRCIAYCIGAILLVACDADKSDKVPTKPAEIKSPVTQPETKTGLTEVKQELKLSIDDLPIDFIQGKTNEAKMVSEFNFLNTQQTEQNSDLFEALNNKSEESNISYSGKLLLNDNDDYLESLDGAQIRIKIKTK